MTADVDGLNTFVFFLAGLAGVGLLAGSLVSTAVLAAVTKLANLARRPAPRHRLAARGQA